MNKDPDVKSCLAKRAEQCGLIKAKLAGLKSLVLAKSLDKEVEIKTMVSELYVLKDTHNLIMKELKLLCVKRGLDASEFEESSFTLNTDIGRCIAVAQSQIFKLKQEKADAYRPYSDAGDITMISPQDEGGNVSGESVDARDQEIETLRRRLSEMQYQSGELDEAREQVEILQSVLSKQEEDHEEESSYYRSTTDALRKDLMEASRPGKESSPGTSTPKAPDRGRMSFGDYSRVGLGQEELFAISHVVGKTQSDTMRQMLDETRMQQQKFYTRMNAPKVECRMFEGDLTKFQSFLSRFDDLVGNTDNPYSVKLNTLLQYCDKDVLKHLGCCDHVAPREGYEMARKILKQKYGKPYLVANAWIEKVMNYPQLQSPESMSLFASELKSAKETLQSMGYLSELDNTDKRRAIVSKLPTFVQNRWRKKHRESNDRGTNVSFDQLIDVVQQASDEMDDPIYGSEVLSKYVEAYSKKRAPTKKRQLASNLLECAAETVEEAPTKKEFKPGFKKGGSGGKFVGDPCAVCQGDHFTRRCAQFENMSPQERAQLVKEKKMCHMCLSTRHFLKDCRFDWVCQIKGCLAKHNTTLHAALTGAHVVAKEEETSGGSSATGNKATVKMKPMASNMLASRYLKNDIEAYALPTVPVLVHGPGYTVQTNAMLDTGGGFTIITKELKEKAGLKEHKRVEFNLGTIVASEDVVADFVTFEVQGLLSKQTFGVINATVMDRELVDPESVDALRNLSTWPHLRDLKLPLHDTSEVGILIGQDNAHLLHFDEKISDITWCGPKAKMTPLGWTVFGLKMGLINAITREVHTSTRKETEKLCQAVEKMWALDEVPRAPIYNPEDQGILDMWKAEARLIDNHVVLPMPIKGQDLDLPNNADGVLKRHATLGKRLMKNADLRKKFTAEMHKNFDKGYAEDAAEEARNGYEWYHPLQPVIDDVKKPGKCRIVGDLAYIYLNRCLNNDVCQGPNFTAQIADVMTKFRRYQVAVTGDVEKMYNQVKVPESQRDCLRFFWWVDDDPTKPVTKHRMTTQMFGGVWSAAAAMYALQWLAEHFSSEYDQRVLETVKDHFYVDDMLDSLVSVLKTIKWLKDVRELLMRGSFNLVKIGSNSQAVLDSIPVEARAPAYAEMSFEKGEDIVDHTVGSVWRPLEDTLGFRVVQADRPRTRRGVLSVMSSLYDPLGLVSPFVLLARILLQEVCKSGYEWDEILGEEVQRRWEDWLDGLQHVQKFTIPRWLNMTDDPKERYQMHAFSDASESGYGVVIYLLIKDDTGQVMHVKLLRAKAKVTPVKPVTIPRLELCAAVEAVKTEEQMKKYLGVDTEQTIFWCDSQIVLNYLKGEAWQYKTFVSHRVLFIQERTEVEQWRHIPGEMNIADKASRGMSGREMCESEEWRNGPEFLMKIEDWPSSERIDVDRDQLETKKRVIFKYTVYRNEENSEFRKKVFDRFSEWNDLLRFIVAWHRILGCLKEKRKGGCGEPMVASEYKDAENFLIKLAQKEYISNEQRRSRIFEKLFPYSEDGLLRVGGRLMKATLSYEEKYPPILPKCPLQKIYLRYVHKKCGHGGVERTYAEARQRYWIMGGKSSVKAVVNDCVTCRKLRGRFGEQVMAPLPEHRVAEGRAPLERIGIDYFGPIHVKVNRTTQKRWVCMIVCLVTRAVHIEPAHDLSTASFLNVLQRFISRRGKPALIVSDNGTNFVGAKREMRETMDEWNQENIGRYMAENEIEWRFNTPTASHHGGVWERLIRSARSLMMALSKDQLLNDDKLNTLGCAIEQIMNSRPLTTSTEEAGEPMPITPNHLLNLRKAEAIPGNYELGDTIDRKWKQVQYLAKIFWKRWTGEYLKSLQERKKWLKVKKNFAVGDVVLMLNEGSPRMKWPLGRIEEVVTGIDGMVRSVKVRNKDGLYSRPITKLVPLECD